MPSKIQLLTLFLFISGTTYGQNLIHEYKKYIKNSIHHPHKTATYKAYWKGLEEIFSEYKKASSLDLNKVDTLYVVFSGPDEYVNFFTEARIWNRQIDLSVTTSDIFAKKVVWNVVPTKRDPITTNASVMAVVDLIKNWIELKDTASIHKQSAKCTIFGGSRYLSFIAEKQREKYSVFIFGFENLCLKQPDIRWKLELQD